MKTAHFAQKENLTTILLAAVIVVTAFNVLQTDKLSAYTVNTASFAGPEGSVGADITPKGVPVIYGEELGVSYDDVSVSTPQKADATIGKIGLLDVNIELTGDDLQRYIAITSRISCEYCCGAESIIFSNGDAACGCAHSYAMRGLAKYLITEHGDEYTNDQILEELGKWKTLFFPDQITVKADVLQSMGVELNYVNLASNKYRDVEKGATGGMVGGC